MGLDELAGALCDSTQEDDTRRFQMAATPTDCIVLTKLKNKKWYPAIRVNGKHVRAHKAAWQKAHGAVPDGLCVLHRCDNRHCVNVNHLFLGTQKDNVADMFRKGRNHIQKGFRHKNAKITEQSAIRIKMLKNVLSERDVASALGIAQQQISKIMSGKAWQHVTATTRYSI